MNSKAFKKSSYERVIFVLNISRSISRYGNEAMRKDFISRATSGSDCRFPNYDKEYCMNSKHSCLIREWLY